MKILFKINIFTYLFWLLIILSGYINYFIIYIFILTIHELGHIIIIYLLKYKIESITIYPFGGIIKTNIALNINSLKLFFISFGGILFQTLLFLIIKDNNTYTYQIFYNLNISIIIFNLIPFYPADGYKILLSIYERIFAYRVCLIISYIVSFISLIVFFYTSKNIFIFILIYYMNINYVLLFEYTFNKFILERYLKNICYKRKKYIKSIKNIYKCKNNYLKINNKYISEKEYLNIYFNN